MKSNYSHNMFGGYRRLSSVDEEEPKKVEKPMSKKVAAILTAGAMLSSMGAYNQDNKKRGENK